MANRKLAAALGLLALALFLALLACTSPVGSLSPSSSGVRNGPYFACATGTPIPTIQVTDTVWDTCYGTATPSGPVVPYGCWVTNQYDTTPVPTHTPYYVQAKFYAGQAASFNEFQLSGSIDADSERTIITFEVVNRAGDARTLQLSTLAFVEQDQRPILYDPELQAELQAMQGLPSLELVEAELIPAGGTRIEKIVFRGQHQAISLLTNTPAFGAMQMGTPIQFVAGNDPVSCPFGPAAWPVPPPMAGGALRRGDEISVIPAGYGLAIGSVPPGSDPMKGADYAYAVTFPFGCGKGYSNWNQAQASRCAGAGDAAFPGIINDDGSCSGVSIGGLCYAGDANGTYIGFHAGIDFGGFRDDFWNQVRSFPIYSVSRGTVIEVVDGCGVFCGGAPGATDPNNWTGGAFCSGDFLAQPPEVCGCDRTCGSGYGNHVLISSDVGGGQYVLLMYAHLYPGSISVSVGDTVECGQALGNVGNTGNSWGPHLHWETKQSASGSWYGVSAVDPATVEELWAATCALGQ